MRVSPSTIQSYETTERIFSSWCESTVRVAFPASEETACAFIDSMSSKGLRMSTITRHMSAIAWLHRRDGHPCPTESKVVLAKLASARLLEDRIIARKAPLSPNSIAEILRVMGTRTLAAKRDAAIILLAFTKALKRSNVSAIQCQDISINGDKVFLLGEQIPNGTHLRPADKLREWVSASGLTSGPVFRRITRGDHLSDKPISDQAVSLIVKKRAKDAGFDVSDISSSSLRAGRIKSALSSGASAKRIVKLARLSDRSIVGLGSYARKAAMERSEG
ncbi:MULTISPECIES: hypothetical protein [unclassified Rhizobium]|uniref:hypothetical protein n=1 Tax=unclassified Rhizobium TaxID=2613769 RepID=UPI002889CA5F|nr:MULTISPECIES: hypothetical protein [unclassified Rhizobium]